MNWTEFEDFERAREWINEPQPHQVESGSFYDDEDEERSPCPPDCESCRRPLDECECCGGNHA